ncbi:MAG: ABC transporter permease [Chloroflexi bacterium]|nr:ABC transporter permease [Chloroflexota bacterium]
MLQFIARRLMLLLPVLLGMLLVVFLIVRFIPGDPCVAMLGERATPEKCELFRERYGLNDNLFVQFFRYVANIAKGDFGTSIRFGRPVLDIVAERLPMTIELAFCAMIFATVVGITLGIIAALNRNSFVDVLTMLIANTGVSMPVFWLGMMLAYIFALLLKNTPFFIPPSGRLSAGISVISLFEVWGLQDLTGFPKFVISLLSNSVLFNSLVTGNWAIFKDALWHLILPSLAVGTIPLCVIARMTRSSLLEVLGQDYIRAARAKGLTENLVIRHHAMRNAWIPIVTTIGLEFGSLLSGAVLTETVFALPGVGTSLVAAILSRDYPVVQGFTIMVALIFIIVNLVVDISYAYLDPRIRLE